MMRPPRGLWLFISLKASCVHRNVPVRLRVHDLCPRIVRQVLEQREPPADAGIVEKHIEAPKRDLGLREQRSNGSRIADIGRHGQRLGAFGTDFLCGGIERLAAAAGENDGIAIARKRQRCRFADAGSCARNQSNLATSHGRTSRGRAALCRIAPP